MEWVRLLSKEVLLFYSIFFFSFVSFTVLTLFPLHESSILSRLLIFIYPLRHLVHHISSALLVCHRWISRWVDGGRHAVSPTKNLIMLFRFIFLLLLTCNLL
ncbi:hypothetical protein GQ43DRAFT_4141 [Delitschia confertaspora ATCC 74209]|uniref:Uncharacterized protein n=1 Tax=Delitschia confertaspora ATCC 74209 TaxID=1513339 RepID=A0A9P4MWT6_9PLEO|nr:hypothetical protein GQ43DRAFT_4141 [Delitschia confertaspora ATCC 74209]